MIDVETRWATYKNCVLRVGNYKASGAPAIQIWSPEDGPIATLTVCLPDEPLDDETESFVDVNNFPDGVALIEKYGLGRRSPWGRVGFSGYCMYPLYEFDLDELKKHEKEDC